MIPTNIVPSIHPSRDEDCVISDDEDEDQSDEYNIKITHQNDFHDPEAIDSLTEQEDIENDKDEINYLTQSLKK